MSGASTAPRPLTCNNGKIEIGFDGAVGTPKDWYGLYRGAPDGSNWATNLVDSEWQWAQTANSYVTSQTSGDDLYAAYWSYENGAYVLESYVGPKDIFCS